MNVEVRYPPWWESRDTVSSPDSLKTVFHCLDLGLGSYCLGFGLCLDDHCLNLGLDLALAVLVLYLEIKTVQDTWRPTRCIIQHSMSLPVRWCATILSFNSLTFGHVCVFAVSSPDIFHCFGLGTYTVLPSLIVHALYLTFMFASVAVTIST